MVLDDIHDIYDYIELNNPEDCTSIIVHCLNSRNPKYSWLNLLSDDKLVDLFEAKIKEKNHIKNRNLIQRYYDEFIKTCV